MQKGPTPEFSTEAVTTRLSGPRQFLSCNQFYFSNKLYFGEGAIRSLIIKKTSLKKSLEKSKKVLEQKRKTVKQKCCIKNSTFTVTASNFLREQLKRSFPLYHPFHIMVNLRQLEGGYVILPLNCTGGGGYNGKDPEQQLKPCDKLINIRNDN